MSIHVGNKEVVLLYIGKRAITAVYEGTHLVWQAIRSCYGAGFWQQSKPWLNNDGWKYKN